MSGGKCGGQGDGKPLSSSSSLQRVRSVRGNWRSGGSQGGRIFYVGRGDHLTGKVSRRRFVASVHDFLADGPSHDVVLL
jgi:hypothetical protein